MRARREGGSCRCPIAKEKDDLATTGRQFVDDLLQLLDFGLTPDEWGLRAGFLDSLRAYETPGLDRLDPPLDSHLAQGLEHEAVDDRSRLAPAAIVPGSATPCRRAATLFVSPSEIACGSADPTRPTATSPVLIPTRALKSEIPHALSTSRA